MVEKASIAPSPAAPTGGRPRSWLLIALLTLVLVRTLLLTAFMADPLRTQGSPRFFDTFYLSHNCLTAYVHAAELARAGAENLYLPENYTEPYGPFRMDEFYYPPPFLLLTGGLLTLSPDFVTDRFLFFLLDAAGLALALWLGARAFGGELGRRVGLAALLIWASTPFLLTLQIGNFQILAFALSLLSLLAFRRGRPALGGALLAFATISKIFPGVLVAYLLFRRRFRDVAWVTVWGLLWLGAGVLAFGGHPLERFLVYELPRIASGEAFAWLRIDELWWVRAINHSVPGLGLKLGTLFGALPSPGLEQGLSLAYSALLLGLAFVASRRPDAGHPLIETQLAIALVALGSLRSPFVPDTYALIGPLWLWSVAVAAVSLTPAEAGGKKRLAAWLLLFLPLAFVLPVEGIPLPGPVGRILLSLVPQAFALGLLLRTLWRPVAPPVLGDRAGEAAA